MSTNKRMVQEAERFLAEQLSSQHEQGIKTQVLMKTDAGQIRITDVVDEPCHAMHEVKTGRVSLNNRTAAQVSKDLALGKKKGFKPQMNFLKSQITGKCGPTKPLLRIGCLRTTSRCMCTIMLLRTNLRLKLANLAR